MICSIRDSNFRLIPFMLVILTLLAGCQPKADNTTDRETIDLLLNHAASHSDYLYNRLELAYHTCPEITKGHWDRARAIRDLSSEMIDFCRTYLSGIDPSPDAPPDEYFQPESYRPEFFLELIGNYKKSVGDQLGERMAEITIRSINDYPTTLSQAEMPAVLRSAMAEVRIIEADAVKILYAHLQPCD